MFNLRSLPTLQPAMALLLAAAFAVPCIAQAAHATAADSALTVALSPDALVSIRATQWSIGMSGRASDFRSSLHINQGAMS